MACIRHFRSQTYHNVDRYRLLYKPLGWAIILLVVLCPTATTYTVFSFRGRWQACYCTGYKLAIHCYRRQHISGATCCYKKYTFPCGIGNQLPADTWWNYQFFKLTSYISLPPLPNLPTSLSIPIASTIHTHHPYMPPHHTIPIPA